MITLVGGNLYQWDTGRVVSIVSENGSVIHEVHFTTASMNFAYVVKTQVKSDTTYCPIPNILLQQYSDIYCYEVKENCNGEESVSTKILPVQKRNRPEDYIYTEPERITLEGLQDQIDAIGEILEEFDEQITDIQTAVESTKSDINSLSDKYNTLSLKIYDEIFSRQQADTTLENDISSLTNICSSLSSDLDAEISARQSAEARISDNSTLISNIKNSIVKINEEIARLKEKPDTISAKSALQIGDTGLTEECLKDLLDFVDNGGIPYSETQNSAGGITAKIGVTLIETQNSAGGMTATIG